MDVMKARKVGIINTLPSHYFNKNHVCLLKIREHKSKIPATNIARNKAQQQKESYWSYTRPEKVETNCCNKRAFL